MRAALARVRSVAFKSRTALSREPVTTVTQSVFRSVVREELQQAPWGGIGIHEALQDCTRNRAGDGCG